MKRSVYLVLTSRKQYPPHQFFRNIKSQYGFISCFNAFIGQQYFFKVYQLLFRNKFCKFAWWASPTRKIVLGKIQRK
jgi:hypothetical protein